jgi:hypothetical protein
LLKKVLPLSSFRTYCEDVGYCCVQLLGCTFESSKKKIFEEEQREY